MSTPIPNLLAPASGLVFPAPNPPILQWEKVSVATKYKVNIYTTPAYANREVEVQQPSNPDVVVWYNNFPVESQPLGASLGAPQYWNWRVKAFSVADGWGDWSSIWTFRLPAPRVVDLLSPGDKTCYYTGESMVVDFEEALGEEGYKILVDDDPGFGSPSIFPVPDPSASPKMVIPYASLPGTTGVLNWKVQGNFGATNFDTGFHLATIATDYNWGSTTPWNNKDNIKLMDGNTTWVTAGPPYNFSDRLVGSTLGFSIPVDASIKGIEFEVRAKRNSISSSTLTMATCMGPNPMGPIKSDSSLPLVLTTLVYGSPTDLWGVYWTPDMLNSPQFGFNIQWVSMSGVRVDVDYIRVKVYYTTGTGVVSESQVRTLYKGLEEVKLIKLKTYDDEVRAIWDMPGGNVGSFDVMWSYEDVDFPPLNVASIGLKRAHRVDSLFPDLFLFTKVRTYVSGLPDYYRDSPIFSIKIGTDDTQLVRTPVDYTDNPALDSGTSTLATQIRITDTSKSWVVDAYKNMYVHITTGVGAGAYAKITGNAATYLDVIYLTPSPAASGDTYEILSEPKHCESEVFLWVAYEDDSQYELQVDKDNSFSSSNLRSWTIPKADVYILGQQELILPYRRSAYDWSYRLRRTKTGGYADFWSDEDFDILVLKGVKPVTFRWPVVSVSAVMDETLTVTYVENVHYTISIDASGEGKIWRKGSGITDGQTVIVFVKRELQFTVGISPRILVRNRLLGSLNPIYYDVNSNTSNTFNWLDVLAHQFEKKDNGVAAYGKARSAETALLEDLRSRYGGFIPLGGSIVRIWWYDVIKTLWQAYFLGGTKQGVRMAVEAITGYAPIFKSLNETWEVYGDADGNYPIADPNEGAHLEAADEVANGTATGGSTTTLADSGASWPVNGYRDFVVIIEGKGFGKISANTATQLTFSSYTLFGTATPGTGDSYRILDGDYKGIGDDIIMMSEAEWDEWQITVYNAFSPARVALTGTKTPEYLGHGDVLIGSLTITNATGPDPVENTDYTVNYLTGYVTWTPLVAGEYTASFNYSIQDLVRQVIYDLLPLEVRPVIIFDTK